MTTDREVHYVPVQIAPARPPGHYAKLSLVAVTCGAATLMLAWVYIGSLLIHKPVMKEVRPALYLAYLVAVWATLAIAAVAVVQFIIYFNNRMPGKTPMLKGFGMTCVGIGLALASYVILVGMKLWLEGWWITIAPAGGR